MKNPNRILSIYAAGISDEPEAYRGVGFYRSVAPAEYLKDKYDITLAWDAQAGWKKDYTVTDDVNLVHFVEHLWNKYDTLIIHHFDKPHGIASLMGSRDYFSRALKTKKRIVIDLDDNYDNVQDINQMLFYREKSDYARQRHYINVAIKAADAVTVSTKSLLDYYKGANSNIYHCPNFSWEDYWQPHDMRANEDIVNIVYWGSSSHINDLKSVMDILADILNENPNVRLCLMGQGYFPKLNEHPQVVAIPPNRAFRTFINTVKEYRFDIGIAPLHTGDPFNKYKSNIKYFEYGYFRIPGVFSGDSTHAYYNTVKHGETGLLATNYKDWKKHITRLIKDTKYRHKLGGAAYEDTKNYDMGKIAPLWDKAYEQILKTSSEEATLAGLGLIKGRG